MHFCILPCTKTHVDVLLSTWRRLVQRIWSRRRSSWDVARSSPESCGLVGKTTACVIAPAVLALRWVRASDSFACRNVVTCSDIGPTTAIFYPKVASQCLRSRMLWPKMQRTVWHVSGLYFRCFSLAVAGFDLCMKQSLQDEPGQILGQASVRRSRSFRIHWSPPWATGSLIRSTKDDEQKMTFRRDDN